VRDVSLNRRDRFLARSVAYGIDQFDVITWAGALKAPSGVLVRPPLSGLATQANIDSKRFAPKYDSPAGGGNQLHPRAEGQK
jgi:hypothetical protein